MVHPVVRRDREEVEKLVHLINERLAGDGFEILEQAERSGRPSYASRRKDLRSQAAVELLREEFSSVETEHLLLQIRRMEADT